MLIAVFHGECKKVWLTALSVVTSERPSSGGVTRARCISQGTSSNIAGPKNIR